MHSDSMPQAFFDFTPKKLIQNEQGVKYWQAESYTIKV